MEQLADDVFHITMLLRHGMNAYLVGDVLVDAGGPPFGRRVAQELRHEQRPVSLHVATHAHGDQVGGTHTIVEEFKVPVWAGAADVAACESGKVEAGGLLGPMIRRLGNFPGFPVARALQEGDAVGPGFVVLETPGHTRGHISLWREADRILIAGDVWFNMSLKSTRVGLRPPPRSVTLDPRANAASQRRLAALEPDLVCFGHGPVLREDAAGVLSGWVTKEL
jgi:glyoxylase-like metal-dependent hydrolase (beta-lactamase superfamily II)